MLFPEEVKQNSRIVQFSFSRDHAIFATEDQKKKKTIWAWGDSSNQKLECGQTTCKPQFQFPYNYSEVLAQSPCAGMNDKSLRFVALNDRSVFFDELKFCFFGNKGIVRLQMDDIARELQGFEIPTSQMKSFNGIFLYNNATNQYRVFGENFFAPDGVSVMNPSLLGLKCFLFNVFYFKLNQELHN